MAFTEFLYWARNNKAEYKRLYAQFYRRWYYPEHREEIIEYAKAYQKEYPEKAKLYTKHWIAKNPEKYKEIMRNASKRMYQKNKEVILLYTSLNGYAKRKKFLDNKK